MPLEVLAIEPYHGLSHRAFLEGYRARSRHVVEIWSLPARKWKWRMRGSAYHFAERACAQPSDRRFDVVLVSDFLNLADWRALVPAPWRSVPAVAYFHENQITYPLGENAPVDHHYGWINVSTAFAAERVLFNSQFHRQEFLSAVRAVFAKMPDAVPEALLASLPARTAVFPVGVDLEPHRRHQREGRSAAPSSAPFSGEIPTILWNHRWEWDKGPELFFETLIRLREEGEPFRLVVCGQSFDRAPPIFARAREALADRIDHFGFFPDAGDYLAAAARADVVVSTSVHEFFGVSVIEAIFLGCLPVLPRRLSYPEIVPPHLHPFFLYGEDRDFYPFLRDFLRRPPRERGAELQQSMGRYDWRVLAPELDLILEQTSSGAGG